MSQPKRPKRFDGILPALPSTKTDERGIRENSATNQLRMMAKAKPMRRALPTLEPLERQSSREQHPIVSRDRESLQKQIHGPVSLQWIVDEFVQAAGRGDVEKVDQYIRGGIPIDLKHSVLQYTALHAASAVENDAVTKLLVHAGADVNALTNSHESVLHLAARYGTQQVAKEALRNHADLRVTNTGGLTAMDVASSVENRVMAQMLQPLPDPPTNVHATSVDSTSLTITWDTFSSPGLPEAPKLTYQYRVVWRLSGSSGGEFSEISSTCYLRLTNLMPSSEYTIYVHMGSPLAGWSAPSNALVIETVGDVPNALAAPIITHVSENSISMNIRLPLSNGGEIQSVSIQVQCTGSISRVRTSTFRHVLKPADQDQNWEVVQCDVHMMESIDGDDTLKKYCVTGLFPGHIYYFRVKVCNQYGWSPDGESSDGICTNDIPSIVHKSARSVRLVWTKPYSTELIDKYQVQARASYSTTWEVMEPKEIIQKQTVELIGLIPSTAYSFRVVPHYAQRGWEDAEICTHTPLISTDPTTPEPPHGFRIIERTAHSITLTWEIPRCNGHALLAYQLDYRSVASTFNTYGQWHIENTEISVDMKSYVVQRLRRGQTYEFRIRARNTLGDGEYYVAEPVATYAFVPPTAPMCFAKTSFSLDIGWEEGTSPHEEETTHSGEETGRIEEVEYEVQMCQVPSIALADDYHETLTRTGTWVTIADGLTSRRTVISGLSPLGCYCFRVRGRAARGVTPIFSTISRPGTTETSLSHEHKVCQDATREDPSSVYGPISDVFQTLRRM